MTDVLQLSGVSHSFKNRKGRIPVLNDIDLQLAQGQMVGVLGESGSGKTTLLLICGAMMRPESGQVSIQDEKVFEWNAAARSRYRAAQIGFLFQTLELVPYLSLLDNVRLSNRSSNEFAIELLDRLGLADRLKHKPDELSHGQRQRGALARAMAHRPPLIIADEPTGNLDPGNSQQVLDALRKYADDGGAVLIASHDPELESVADQCLRLDSGKMI